MLTGRAGMCNTAMTTPELLAIRLQNQRLMGQRFAEPAEAVSWMGAMQAQALDQAKWGIGVRLADGTVKAVEEALNTGKIIRTHILRPTWHFVTAEDIHWMFDLSNPQIKPIYISYCRMIGADESLVLRALPVVENSLAGGKHLTKEEIGGALHAAGITADGSLLNQIICRAEMEGILCNGRLRGNKQTFTLLEEWAPRKETIGRDEALERLARRYFTSHGPATVHDFSWWSGLTVTDCRRAVAMLVSDLVSVKLNGRDFLMMNDIEIPVAHGGSALLLPSFDEFVVSYKDRSEMISETHYGKVMTKNGLFSPTVMLGGEIVGSWKKSVKKGAVETGLFFFEKTPQKTQGLFKLETERLGRFYSCK